MTVPSIGRWRRVLVFCGLCCLGWAAAAWGGTLPGQFSDELNTDHYDCLLTLQPAATLAPAQAVTLALETGKGTRAIRCVITSATIRLFNEMNGKSEPLGEVPAQVTPGTAYDLTIMRRGTTIALYHHNAFLFRGTAPTGTGTQATVTANDGWSVTDARIQRLEPVSSPMTSCAPMPIRKPRKAPGRK